MSERISYKWLLLITLVVPITACEKSPTEADDKPKTLTYNGFSYSTVIIGKQEWTVENLRTTQYNDGTDIPYVTDDSTWAVLDTGAYCAYDNDNSKVKTYGYLYNWYAVGTGKLAPGGWRVPTDADWDVLVSEIGGSSRGGTKLKSQSGWNYNGNGTDDYGFSALPGGRRDINNGYFNFVGFGGYWWSATAYGSSAWFRYLSYNSSNVFRSYGNKRYGFSVRLVRDK